MSAITADVQLVLNERSASQVSQDVERHASGASRAASDAFSRNFKASDAITKEITKGLNEAVSGATSQFGAMGRVADQSFRGISSSAGLAAVGVAGIGVATVAVGKQLYDLGAQWDDMADSVVGATGKMGAQLDQVMDTVKRVGDQSAISLQDISKHAGAASQNLHLVTDADLTAVTQELANIQQVTGQVVNTQGLGKAFRLFDVSGAQAEVDTLNQLTAASQATLIPINDLVTALTNSGKAGKEAGLNLQETLGLVLTLEESGVSFEKAGPALSIALKNWAKDGRDANKALAETVAQIKAFTDAGNDAAALRLAQATFGKGYIDFFNAIKDGTLDVKSLTDGLTKLGDTQGLIDKQKKATEDWHESWQKITHHLSSVFEPAAEYVFSTVNHKLEEAGQALSGFGDWIHGIGFAWEALAGVISGHPLQVQMEVSGPSTLGPDGKPIPTGQPAAGNNPLSQFGPQPVPGAATSGPATLDQLLGLAPSTPAAPLPAPFVGPNQPGGGSGPNLYKQWYPDQGSGGTKPPQIPFPAEYGQPPAPGETPEHWRDRMNVIEQQHSVAEKRALVDQLEQSNTATQDQIVKARNDLVTAQMAQTAAEQQLNQQKAQDVQVPYGPGYGAAPRPGETSSQYSAEQSFYEAQHKSAQARAELQQLEASGTATTQQLTEAHNKLIKATGDEYQAQLRLSEAFNKTNGQMDDLGAKLDSDFGVSKGLAGIAENLTKFLFNLAFAPIMAQLKGTQVASGYDPEKDGKGLLGIAAQNGAFGPQFQAGATTPMPSTSPSGPVPTGATTQQPGISGAPAGMPMPGESSREFAHRVMMPFWQGKGFTVGDHAEDQYHEHQHGALDIMVPNIAAGQQVLQQVLSDPNVYGAIFNNQTYGYGHGTTPQPYGSTGSPTDRHEDHVHAWYKPGDPSDIKPTGAAGPLGAPGAPGGYQQVGSTPFGSIPIPLPVTIVGGMSGGAPGAPPGSPASGQGSGAPPGPPGAANWDALAGFESSGNWSANTGNGYSGGLQFTPSTWNAFGGGQFAPAAWQASPDQQKTIADRVLAGQGSGAWPAASAAHPEWFKPGGWQGPGVPPGISGGGQGPILGGASQGPGVGGAASGPGDPYSTIFGGAPPAGGNPMSTPLGGGPGGLGGGFRWGGGGAPGQPGVGGRAAPSQSVMGGRQFGQGLPASGGIGIGGGLIGAAESAAASAGSMFPGGGAAGAGAQIGFDEINRAIGAMGQYAGNAVSGVLETLSLNDSALADPGKSWLGRLTIAAAGMRPALPNSAGEMGGKQNENMAEGGKKPAPPLTPEQAAIQAAAQQGGDAVAKQGNVDNSTHIAVTNNRATEDGTGRDIQAHLSAGQAAKQINR